MRAEALEIVFASDRIPLGICSAPWRSLSRPFFSWVAFFSLCPDFSPRAHARVARRRRARRPRTARILGRWRDIEVAQEDICGAGRYLWCCCSCSAETTGSCTAVDEYVSCLPLRLVGPLGLAFFSRCLPDRVPHAQAPFDHHNLAFFRPPLPDRVPQRCMWNPGQHLPSEARSSCERSATLSLNIISVCT